MSITINANQSLKKFFKDDKYKNIQNCITHCNQQIIYEQKSWKDLAFDNKYTIITRVAFAAILAFIMPMFRVSVCVAVPMLCMYRKTLTLESRATKKALETMLVFQDIFFKNTQQASESGENVRAGWRYQKEGRNFSMLSSFMKTLPKYGPISINSLENISIENLKMPFREFNNISVEDLGILLEDLDEAPLGVLERIFPVLQNTSIQNLPGKFLAADLKRICPELKKDFLSGLSDASLEDLETKLEGNIPEKLEQLRKAKKVPLEALKGVLTEPSLKRLEVLIKMQELWNMKKIKELVWEHANENLLGSLEKVAFIQMIKDHNCARKMQGYKSAHDNGLYSVLFGSGLVDELLRPFSFISFKINMIFLAVFSAISLYTAKQSFKTYKAHVDYDKMELETLKNLLPRLNNALELPLEVREQMPILLT